MGIKGIPERQLAIYHTFNVEDLIEAGHPLRAIKRMVDRAAADMSRTFRAANSEVGRPGMAAAAYNLVRMKNLLAACEPHQNDRPSARKKHRPSRSERGPLGGTMARSRQGSSTAR